MAVIIRFSVHLDQKDPLSHQHYVHCTKMILHQASETTAETPDTSEAPTATEGEAPGHNQHPLCQRPVTQHFCREPFFQFLIYL